MFPLTYLVQLLTFKICRHINITNLALIADFTNTTIPGYYWKTVTKPMLFCLLIQIIYKRTITIFIADDKVSASETEHDVA